MNFFLGFLAGSGAFDGLAAAVIVFWRHSHFWVVFNAVIASIPAFYSVLRCKSIFGRLDF